MNPEQGTLLEVPLDELFIDHNFNHRGDNTMGKFDVADLAKNIEDHGLQCPITVQPWNEGKYKYKVVAGHRRATAFKVLKRPVIPAFVKVYKNQLEAKTASLIENIHRKGLNIKQEAHALKTFGDEGWTEDMIARHLQMSRGWVKIRMLLLNLPEKVQDYAAIDLINQEHIRQLQGKTERAQLEFIHELKEAKARGEKLTIDKPVRKINPHALKPRNREEIFEKITELYKHLGEMGFWSRCLSWSAGQISEYELMKSFEEFAKENGVDYKIPASMLAEGIA